MRGGWWANVLILVAVIVIHAIAPIVVFTRPQRFQPPLKVHGKSRAEFTNVFKSIQAALRQVHGKSFAEITKLKVN